MWIALILYDKIQVRAILIVVEREYRMRKSDIFFQTYLNLEKEVIEVSKYIFFTDEVKAQLETFSPYIADLLVNCCVQIEAISKELYFDNGGPKKRGEKNIFFDEDCLKWIDIKWGTHNKVVLVVAPYFNLTKDENRIIKPLKEAHKRQGTYWERAYQAVKHDRYSSLQKGNVKALLQALAALFLLNLYYRKDSWLASVNNIPKIDYSMGSKIFTVKRPEMNGLWYGNSPIVSESPYVVKYQEDAYKKIEEMQKQEEQALADYLAKQPEFSEEGFKNQLDKAYEREKADSKQRVIIMQELAEYRLNKKIPYMLPFEEKKALLLKSEEWNGRINQANMNITEKEITEDNIQEIIKKVASLWGIEMINKFQKFKWAPIATDSDVCKIYIPD